MLLEPELLAKLEGLQVHTRRKLVGRFGGDHRSRRYGNAVDFADFREYTPGDDFRRIDYHVLARLDHVLIKLYESDDEVTVRILLDTSASMALGGKLRQAKRLAAALGFVALTAHDAVAVHTFPAEGRVPRFVGRAAVPGFFDYLEGLEAGGETPFAAAAGTLLSRQGPSGITVVISDLLTSEWSHLMGLRARGSELILLHLLSEDDTSPELAGDLELIDNETANRLIVSLTPELVDAYATRIEAWRAEVRQRCIDAGGSYLEVGAEDDVEELLLTSWRRSGVLR